MSTGVSAPPKREGWGYPGTTVAAALLATLFFPLFALIAALVLIGGEQDPVKRRSLVTWAWASGGWLALQVILVLVASATLFAGSSGAETDRSGPCVGGPEIGAVGQDVSGNGTKFAVPCAISGTATVDFP